MEKNPAKKINLSDYIVEQTIGTGSFGRVKLCSQKKGAQFTSFQALKVQKKAEIIRLKQVDHIMSEISILSVIDHPFQIKMHGLAQDERFQYIFLDYIAGGELFNYLRSIGNLNNDEAKSGWGCVFFLDLKKQKKKHLSMQKLSKKLYKHIKVKNTIQCFFFMFFF